MESKQANDRQVGGTHYQDGAARCPGCHMELQHWDIAVMFNLGYLVGVATKYLFRFRSKDGLRDLDKAIHYIEKQREVYARELELEKGEK